MEKINLTNSRGLNLVGNFYSADSKSVIVMSHGFTGDKSEWGRFDKTSEALNKEGYNVLTFDFSGCGESDDDSLTVAKQVDDLQCAIKYVSSRGLTNLGLFGHSLGGLISAKVYTPNVKVMVFWAPVTNKINYSWDKKYSKEQFSELKEKGYITKTRDKGVRRIFIIDKQMLIDRESVNQKELLSHIKCPVLIVHGDEDDRVPLEDSKNALQYLSSESKLEIIAGADHDFPDKTDQFVKYTVSWFNKYLKP